MNALADRIPEAIGDGESNFVNPENVVPVGEQPISSEVMPTQIATVDYIPELKSADEEALVRSVDTVSQLTRDIRERALTNEGVVGQDENTYAKQSAFRRLFNWYIGLN